MTRQRAEEEATGDSLRRAMRSTVWGGLAVRTHENMRVVVADGVGFAVRGSVEDAMAEMAVDAVEDEVLP